MLSARSDLRASMVARNWRAGVIARYYGEHIFVHEFAHAIHRAIRDADPAMDIYHGKRIRPVACPAEPGGQAALFFRPVDSGGSIRVVERIKGMACT